MHRLPAPLALLLVLGQSACTRDAAHDASTHDIVLDQFATLSGVGDSIDLSIGMPRVSAAGLIVVPIDHPPSGAVGVFDSSGRFVRRIGRHGGGPGEFRNLQGIGLGPGDSLWVIDAMYSAHVFAPPPSGEFVRTLRFGRANTGLVTPFGILSAGVYTPNGVVPAHLASWDGALIHEFGASAQTEDIHDRLGVPGLRDSLTVWVPYSRAYVVELLGADGKVHQRIERRVAWVPPDSGTRGFPSQVRPQPRIAAVIVGPHGYLWVLIRRAHRDWKPVAQPSLGRPDAPVEARRLGAVNLSEIFEGILEVLDPRDGRLIASLEVSGGALGFPAADLLYSVEQDDLGRVSTHIWRLGLKPR